MNRIGNSSKMKGGRNKMLEQIELRSNASEDSDTIREIMKLEEAFY